MAQAWTTCDQKASALHLLQRFFWPQPQAPCHRGDPTFHTACSFKSHAGLSHANCSFHILGVVGWVGCRHALGRMAIRHGDHRAPGELRVCSAQLSCSHDSAAPGCLGDLAASGAMGVAPGLCPALHPGPSVAPWASPSSVPGEPAFVGCDPTGPGTDGGRVGSPMSSHCLGGVCVPAPTKEASVGYKSSEACPQRAGVGSNA